MAQTVRPTRRRRSADDDLPPNSAVLDAVQQDEDLEGDVVAQVLDGLRSVITDQTKVLIYKMPPKGGNWEYLKTISPPINSDTILDELKTEFGGGQYNLRIHDGKHIVTAKKLNIAGPPRFPEQEGAARPDNTMRDLLPLLLNTQTSSSDKQMQMMTMMMQQQQQASQNQMTMMMGMMTAILPVVAGGKDTPASMIAALAPLLQKEEKSGMGDTLALLQIAKTLVSPESAAEGGDENMFQTLIKTLGPGFMDAVSKMQATQQQPQPQPMALPGPPQVPRPAMPIMVPPQFRPNPVAPPLQQPEALPAAANAPSNPILALVFEDVLFFANRGHDPALAAEAVLDRIEKAGTPEHELLALVVQFQSAADPFAELAAMGLDLRGYGEWGNAFISELVTQYTDNSGEGEPPEREAGGAENAG